MFGITTKSIYNELAKEVSNILFLTWLFAPSCGMLQEGREDSIRGRTKFTQHDTRYE